MALDPMNTDGGLALARKLAEEEAGTGRAQRGVAKFVVSTVAVCWSLFQLSIASWLILDSWYIRAIHLAFAIFIVYASFPMFRKPRLGIRYWAATDRVPIMDWVLAVTAAIASLYVVLDYQGIVYRYGAPIPRDIFMGILLVVLLLEASRRTIGPALSVIATLFILYAFLGPYMPDVISFKGVSLNRFVGQMTMSTEGIYGIPLDVSATIVFLFVLFGSMLEKAGAGQFFIQLALSLLGGFKGGPAKAAILSSGLTGMVSGSSIANVVTTGTFTIPLMKRVGYPPKKAAALEVAASTDGQLAPPIMGAAAFIIAEYVNLPYIEVCKAAAIPAFASYAALLFISHLEASKLGLQGLPREELPPFFKTLLGGLQYLIPLAMLIYELVILRHTPQRSAFNAIWVLGLLMIVQPCVRAYKSKESVGAAFKKGLLDIIAALNAGARNMVSVAMATAAAGIIVGVVAMGLGGLINQVVDVLAGGNIYLLLGITALASLIIGMGLPTTATYIVMASLTAPAIVMVGGSYGFEVPLIAAHLFCFFFGILADDTPPVGLAAYAASAIAKSDPIRTGLQGFTYDIRTAILPFMFIFNHDLILYGISSWSQGLLIFAMACLGNFAFAAATQGWLITRNRIYEVPLLLGVTLIMMRPDVIAPRLGLDYAHRHWAYLVGLALFGFIYFLQKLRSPRQPA
ncbi:TRAP transporter permease [Desulfosoma caldarium]|uniref:TRAP transporter 4TM/12TM fusion protein n=1 Tax=Desulfosoma caldarium TaxID=610254 RepID=A0A3N1UQ95_9BACT|nr:TRAP transporter permease [Desulfosoma caldarium]ROQ93292.1 TRAP transporter 4TM/12TM fusion protein [Desulfosoma caldarium]